MGPVAGSMSFGLALQELTCFLELDKYLLGIIAR